MPKKIDYTLTEDELKHVQVAMKSKKSRVARRASIVHSLHLGYRAEEVAELHQVSRATVHNNFHAFKDEGKEGLETKPIPGRPPKATQAYIAVLEETLERNPQELGFAFTLWTQARLRRYLLDQTGISLSRARFQELMQRLGYVYRRPKYDVSHKQDEELRQQVMATLDELKKSRNKRNRITLYGRKSDAIECTYHQMLDETWAAEACAFVHRDTQKQNAGRCPELAQWACSYKRTRPLK